MATVRVKYRASSDDMREGTLYYQIIHNRVARQISTDYKVYEFEWDVEKCQALLEEAIDKSRKDYLESLSCGIDNELSILEHIIAKFDSANNPYTADDIVATFKATKLGCGFLSFAKKQVLHWQKSGREAASEKLQSTISSFSKFIRRDDISFEEITPDLIEEYEGWLKSHGVCMNTVSFYMRKLRSLYNIAVEKGVTENRMPFRHAYTEIDQTVKRAISTEAISKIIDIDLSHRPKLDFARNIFLLSLSLRGMSFVDLCQLKKNDLKDGVLHYRRQKTHQLMQIRWEKPMQQLLEKIGETDGIYLLPIITSDNDNIRRQCSNVLHNINRNLKKIGKMVRLEIPLTTYVARHSWASLAQSSDVPISDISEGLGHHSVKTTKIYLASLSSTAVDKANSKVLNLVFT